MTRRANRIEEIYIPQERRERNPLITPAGYRRLKSLLEHPAAPLWNYQVGDRVLAEDLGAVESLRSELRAKRKAGLGRPPEEILEWIKNMRPVVPLFQRLIPEGSNLERDWAYIPTMSRADIALNPEEIVPVDADLSRLIVYDTSGVTGHAIQVPHHPRAMALNHPLMEYVLEQSGARSKFSADDVACINVGAQLNTVTFANVFSVWNQAGFAKVNLHPRTWQPHKAQRFFKEHAPVFLTGDPIGFAEMIKWGIEICPQTMLSTAVALSPAVKNQLEAYYRCPVIDTYATTETGPVAYSSPENMGMNILPNDIYVEIIDSQGQPLPEGEHGEICITGGRNPYMPLLRYRTGDCGKLVWSTRSKSDCTPRIYDLEAREAVSFTAEDGTMISPVDVGRVIRAWAFVQHEFIQRSNRSIEMTIRPAFGCRIDAEAICEALHELFGRSLSISVRLDERLGEDRPGAKVVPFRSELGL
jgi:phenylacetate-CoA ligase